MMLDVLKVDSPLSFSIPPIETSRLVMLQITARGSLSLPKLLADAYEAVIGLEFIECQGSLSAVWERCRADFEFPTLALWSLLQESDVAVDAAEHIRNLSPPGFPLHEAHGA